MKKPNVPEEHSADCVLENNTKKLRIRNSENLVNGTNRKGAGCSSNPAVQLCTVDFFAKQKGQLARGRKESVRLTEEALGKCGVLCADGNAEKGRDRLRISDFLLRCVAPGMHRLCDSCSDTDGIRRDCARGGIGSGASAVKHHIPDKVPTDKHTVKNIGNTR